MNLFCHQSFVGGYLFLAASVLGQQQAIRIEAGFTPPVITLSNQSAYKVIVHGSQEASTGNLPQIKGLRVLNGPQTVKQTFISNGRLSVRLEISYTVKPEQVGNFTIPNRSMIVGGQRMTVPSATLRTLPPSKEDLAREEIRKKQELEWRQALFVELSLSETQLYEGQTVPATIDLFILDGLNVTDVQRIQKAGNAFSQSEIKQAAEKRSVTRNGKGYGVYSWPVAITAVMEGTHDLQYSMIVLVRVKRQRGSPFNPFFNDPFFGFGQPEAVSVVSKRHSIDVLPLPMEGRPSSFKGAIGSFKTQTRKDSALVTVGDPIRLTFAVTGKGNFAVIPAPELPSTKTMKVGPPAFLFEGDQNLRNEGTQKFEYVVTPLLPGNSKIPSVPFSYFDPIGKKYVDASTAAQPIKVDPGETWIDPNPVGRMETINDEPLEPNRNFFQTESEPGNWKAGLTPSSVLRSSMFWYIQAGPALCFFVILGWRLRSSRSNKDTLARRLAKLRLQMKTAARSNDSAAFLRAARGAIREQVGSLVKHDRPEALARDEVLEILRQNEISTEVQSEVREVLETVDAREFAAGSNGDFPLKEWRGRVNRLLKRIPRKS